jgi:hypothetical protein
MNRLGFPVPTAAAGLAAAAAGLAADVPAAPVEAAGAAEGDEAADERPAVVPFAGALVDGAVDVGALVAAAEVAEERPDGAVVDCAGAVAGGMAAALVPVGTAAAVATSAGRSVELAGVPPVGRSTNATTPTAIPDRISIGTKLFDRAGARS